MNKTVLILLLALYSASAFTQWGGSGGWGNYGGYGGYSRGRWSGGFTGGWGNSVDLTGDLNGDVDAGQDDYIGDFDVNGANGGAFSCPDAIDNVNSAFDQLVEDVRAQVNEWIVFSDLDAVDEVSYYLTSRCDVQKLEVVAQGSKACKGLGELLKAVVQQSETGAFRAGYQQGAQLSEQALSLGEGVEKSCQVRVVKRQQQRQQKQQSQQEEGGNQEEEIEQPQQQHRHQAGQKHEALTNVLYRKVAKKNDKSTTTNSYGNDFADQYTNKYAGKYSSQYTDKYAGKYTKQYGKDYVDQGKSMAGLGQNGQGKKYGEDQAALSHKINQEYTDKYNKDKNNKNDQWKKYQEKYQHNNEEEDKLKNEEESAFTVDGIFFDLTWM